jgi:FKBP-type peptidyl-prolyl cis-trans isomerase FkpA
MRKIVALICLLLAISPQYHCGKKVEGCSAVSPDVEKNELIAFCAANNINYTWKSSGLFYQIIDSGTGVSPTITSKISINYTGTLLDGTIFDSGTLTNIILNSLIEGMEVGIPLLRKGGHIKLIIPSEMAYGCIGKAPGIPPNTPLYFNILLTDVQ